MDFYRNIFKGFEGREATLTPTEILCVEVINTLEKPTIKELTEFMETSQSNMAYRVSNLIEKNYIRKIQSEEDKREYYLEPTERFYDYYKIRVQYIDKVIDRVSDKFPEEDIDTLEEILGTMSNELMPEVTDIIDGLKNKQIEE